MNWLHQLRLRFRALFQKEKFDAQMDDEMRSHIEMQTQENMEAGMKPEEARYAALRQFGRVEAIKETCRDQRGLPWLETLWQDIRYSARQLRKNPGFTTVAVLTLALGIGATTAIFSVVNTVLLRPFPFREAERILMLWAENPKVPLGIREVPPTNGDLAEWRRGTASFEQIAAFRSNPVDIADEDGAERVGAVMATPSFFTLLGVQPWLGRALLKEDERFGSQAVVISHGLWQRRFGGSPEIVGKPVTINRERRLIVGVMPEGFHFPSAVEMPAAYNLFGKTDLWLPLAGAPEYLESHGQRHFMVLGRLKPEVTPGQAQAELDTYSAHQAQEHPQSHKDWNVWTTTLPRQIAGSTRTVVLLLLGAVGLVLLIASANVACLLLARSNARRSEFAIRAALGAGRTRVIRQLLTESLLLSTIGGGLGLFLGHLGLRFLLAFSPSNIPRLHETTFDGAVFCFGIGISLVTGILFGLAPASHAAKLNLIKALNEAGRSSVVGRRAGAQEVLVMWEVALAVILLIGAALTLQSFGRLLAVDSGFNRHGVAAFDVSLRGAPYLEPPAKIGFLAQVRERLGALAGVNRVAAISHLPLGAENSGVLQVENSDLPPEQQQVSADNRVVTPGYFETMGMLLKKGRDFDNGDAAGKPGVVIVNETVARQFFSDKEALGQRLRIGSRDWATIVGVVGDIRSSGPAVMPRAQVYFPYAQDSRQNMTVVLHAAPDLVPSLERALRGEMKVLDPSLPVANFRTMNGLLAEAVARPRFGSFLMGLFAATALMLTIVGLGGVAARSVSQRTRELGIRMALGAQQRDVLKLVIAQGMRPVLAGLVLGVAGAFGATRWLTSQLYEIKPTDPFTYVGVMLLLFGVTLFACWLPARRAARVDPMVALRSE